MHSTFFQPNRDTWETSIRENKPIVIIFQDKLCSYCKVFDKLVISDNEVQELLFKYFIPLYLDKNAFPEFYDRYSSTILPIHTVHSITGSLIGKCNDSSPYNLIKNLQQLKHLHPQVFDPFRGFFGNLLNGQTIIENSHNFHKKVDLIAEITLSSLINTYDRMYGGWSINGYKIHPSSSLELLLLFYHRSKDPYLFDMIIKTLRSSYRGLFDKTNYGFFEYSNRDWSQIGSMQKSLNQNIAISRNLFHAYQINDDRYYLDILDKTLLFCFRDLWDDELGVFRYGILSDSSAEIYDLSTPYDNSNAGRLLLETNNIRKNILSGKDYFPQILRILSFIKQFKTEYGVPHDLMNPRATQYLLRDQSAYLAFLLDLYSNTGENRYLEDAENLLESIIGHYFDRKNELFKDRAGFPQDFGPLKKILYPAVENACMVSNLVTLSYLSGKDNYLEIARRCITSYYSNFGISREAPYPPEFIIANQRAVESPIELFIVGNPDDHTARRMLFEIQRIYDPFKIVQYLNPKTDIDLIKKKIPTYNPSQQSVAFVKIEKIISPPAFYAMEISKMLNTILEAIRFDTE